MANLNANNINQMYFLKQLMDYGPSNSKKVWEMDIGGRVTVNVFRVLYKRYVYLTQNRAAYLSIS